MKVGAKRRIIVPQSIGYTDLGIGPLPVDPVPRRKLGFNLFSLYYSIYNFFNYNVY
jgi:FKBP-type peptidyl-prolyl cis-trans isomerase